MPDPSRVVDASLSATEVVEKPGMVDGNGTTCFPLLQGGQQNEGLQLILRKLLEQENTLQNIVEKQEGLQQLVQKQHTQLEKRLGVHGIADQAEVAIETEESANVELAKTHKASDDDGFAEGSSFPGAEPVSPTETGGEPHRRRRTMREGLSDVWNQLEMEIMEGSDKKSLLQAIVSHPIVDATMGVIIMLNFAAIFAELQWRGYDLDRQLGKTDTNHGWPEAQEAFLILGQVFNVCYLIELTLRVMVMRWVFFHDLLNVLDGLIIIGCSVDSFILEPLSDGESRASRVATLMRVIRVLRALRLLRFLRVLRVMGVFSALRVLVKTLSLSMQSLVWSMMVVGFIIVSAALLMVQLLAEVVEDTTRPSDLRDWVSQYYGSAARASYTMFEATFSAKWSTDMSRRLIEEISPWFALFWIVYTVTVNFAVIRVISALFLKQTMDVAAIDADRMAVIKLKERQKIMKTLQEIFSLGDQMGDGVLHRWEFEQMMKNPEVLRMFEELELDTPELHLLFDLLAEDDNVADQEEFLTGAMKLKSNVRIVDMIQVLHSQRVMRKRMDGLSEGLEVVDKALHPLSPWRASRHSRLAPH